MKPLQKCLVGSCIFLALLTSGCNGSQETEQNAYVIAIGIDKGSNGQLEVTYQIAKPIQVSSIEQSGGSEAGGDNKGKEEAKQDWTNITISGFSVAETRNELKSTLALIPVFYHTKFIVLGEDLAKDGIGDIVIALIRFQEYRGSMYVAVTSGKAKDFFKEIHPSLATFLFQWYEIMMQTDNKTGYFPGVSLQQLYRSLKSEGQGTYITYVAPNQQIRNSAVKPEKNAMEKLEFSDQAGQILRTGGNPIEVLGAAVFRGDKMVGILKNNQVRIQDLFLRHVEDGFISVKDPLVSKEKKGVNVRYQSANAPQIMTDLTKGKAKAHVHLVVECEITGVASGIHYEDPTYQALLEEYLSGIFTRDLLELIQVTQAMNSDVLGIGDYFRPHFATLPAYKNFHWRELYREAEITGEVECKIRRSGLMFRTSPIKK